MDYLLIIALGIVVMFVRGAFLALRAQRQDIDELKRELESLKQNR